MVNDKICNRCQEKNLGWNYPHHEKTNEWKLAKITRLENGTTHYEPHICPEPKVPERPKIPEHVFSGSIYCLTHPEVLVEPQLVVVKDHICSECGGPTMRLWFR
jgi:hypothetical protein